MPIKDFFPDRSERVVVYLFTWMEMQVKNPTGKIQINNLVCWSAFICGKMP